MVSSLLVSHKLFPAERTRITSIVKMCPFVSISDVSSSKSFSTNGTEEASNFTMGMAFPRVLTSKGHATFLAFIRPYTRMHTFVMK